MYRCEEVSATLAWPCFALDVYGTGVRPTNDAEAESNMTALTSDPAELHKRIQAGLNVLLSLAAPYPTVNSSAVFIRTLSPELDPMSM